MQWESPEKGRYKWIDKGLEENSMRFYEKPHSASLKEGLCAMPLKAAISNVKFGEMLAGTNDQFRRSPM